MLINLKLNDKLTEYKILLDNKQHKKLCAIKKYSLFTPKILNRIFTHLGMIMRSFGFSLFPFLPEEEINHKDESISQEEIKKNAPTINHEKSSTSLFSLLIKYLSKNKNK